MYIWGEINKLGQQSGIKSLKGGFATCRAVFYSYPNVSKYGALKNTAVFKKISP